MRFYLLISLIAHAGLLAGGVKLGRASFGTQYWVVTPPASPDITLSASRPLRNVRKKADLPEQNASADPVLSSANLGADTADGVTSSVSQWVAWGNSPPVYPYLARQQGWQGRVELKVMPGVDAGGGSQVEVSVIKSSGFDLLDQAAVDWVKACRIDVATLAGSGVYLPIEYQLED